MAGDKEEKKQGPRVTLLDISGAVLSEQILVLDAGFGRETGAGTAHLHIVGNKRLLRLPALGDVDGCGSHKQRLSLFIPYECAIHYGHHI